MNLAPSLGSSPTRFQNLGQVRNYGDEAMARIAVVDRRNVKVDFTASGSWNTNHLDDLGLDALGNPIPPVFFSSSTQVFKTGFPLGAYFVKPIVSFADANGDGLIGCPTGPGTPACEVTLGDSAGFRGTPFPKMELSFSPELALGSMIRLTATLDHRGGQKLFNNTAYFREVSIGNGAAVQTPSAANLKGQAAVTAGRFSGSNFTYDGFIEDASFTKLREVARHPVPAPVVRRASRCRFGGPHARWAQSQDVDEVQRHRPGIELRRPGAVLDVGLPHLAANSVFHRARRAELLTSHATANEEIDASHSLQWSTALPRRRDRRRQQRGGVQPGRPADRTDAGRRAAEGSHRRRGTSERLCGSDRRFSGRLRGQRRQRVGPLRLDRRAGAHGGDALG